jgi:hypothetical protein
MCSARRGHFAAPMMTFSGHCQAPLLTRLGKSLAAPQLSMHQTLQ